MDEFELFKERWQQQPEPVKGPDLAGLKASNTDALSKLRRTQLWSAIALLATVVVLTWIGFFSGITFSSATTYTGLVLVLVVVLTQSLINFAIYRRLGQLAVTSSASEHLQQWETYYSFRKKMVRINSPLYFIGLNAAMGLYFIEILGYFSSAFIALFLVLYLGWMAFAYLYLGRRALRKEYGQIEAILENLRRLHGQLKEE